MPSKKSEDLDNDVLLEIVVAIQSIVEKRHGRQETGARVIDYALHAALTMIDAATRHQSDTDRVKSLRSGVALFSEIAENDYILSIDAEAQQTRH